MRNKPFGSDFDRFGFPWKIERVTAGHGGEALLVFGSEKNALIDCGMAYCGQKTVNNIHKVCSRLDFILLSHSHYDHIGALPYIRDAFPGAAVCGSEKCSRILPRDNARRLMKELGTTARNLYDPDNTEEIRTDGLMVDQILRDGDVISLGKETIIAYETKGHTDCSMSFMLEPVKLLFTSESTGILEGDNYIHTPLLKSFSQGLESLERCMSLSPEYICLPHFGMLPKEFNSRYYEMFRQECESKVGFVRRMMADGLNRDEMFTRYIEKYWMPEKLEEQPFEAFEINSGHILDALIRYIGESENV
ncbi:MAG: MBL fold metallo-hydrolase [Lentihominibacter sp.]